MIDALIFAFIVTWLGAITAYLVLTRNDIKFKVAGEQLPKPPKPLKPYICPHGQISTLTQYTINGQKRTLCKYCYNKEEALKEVENVRNYDLPRL